MSDLFLILDIHFLENFGLMLVKGSVEDYIYILVGVLWIAFSIYKGIKKKKSQKTRTFAGSVPPRPLGRLGWQTFPSASMLQEKPSFGILPARQKRCF